MTTAFPAGELLHNPRIPPWRLVAGGVALFCVACGIFLQIVYLLRPETTASARGIQERTLPDGTILVLEKVTVGTEHSYDWDYTPSFPGWLMGSRTVRHRASTTTPHDAIVVWFSRRNPDTGKFLDCDWWLRSTATDSDGSTVEEHNAERHVFFSNALSLTSGARPIRPDPQEDTQLIVTNSQFQPFRLRESTFKFRVYGAGGAIVAEFDVPVKLPTTRPQASHPRARRPRFVVSRRYLRTDNMPRQRHKGGGTESRGK